MYIYTVSAKVAAMRILIDEPIVHHIHWALRSGTTAPLALTHRDVLPIARSEADWALEWVRTALESDDLDAQQSGVKGTWQFRMNAYRKMDPSFVGDNLMRLTVLEVFDKWYDHLYSSGAHRVG